MPTSFSSAPWAIVASEASCFYPASGTDVKPVLALWPPALIMPFMLLGPG
jgi:hypothetical protein